MIYLDHAATGGYKPAAVQNAVLASMKACANPGRSGHRLSVAAAERVLACRKLLAELFDAESFERVIFTKNCTEALNVALFGTLEKGDHVVTTCLEHNSVLRPLEALKRAEVIEYSVAPLENGQILPETVAALVKPNTRVCCVSAASNVTGYAPDLRAIRARLPEHVLLFTDAAQAAGHLALPMREIGIDALALAGHKGLHAVQGAGALLFSERVNPRPILYGGTGSESYNLGMPAFYPDALESGTLNYPAVCSLFEGALLVKARRETDEQILLSLTEAVYGALSAMPAYRVCFKPNASGICSFAHERIPSEELAGALSERNIAVRGGLHCAPLVHKSLGTFPEGLVRASFSPFQTMREVNALVSALKQI